MTTNVEVFISNYGTLKTIKMARKDMFPLQRPFKNLSLRIESFKTNFSRKVEVLDPLEELYGQYLGKIGSKEISPEKDSHNHQIFLGFRDECAGKLTQSQENYLCKLLKKKGARWFVPLVLNVVDFFSVKLMHVLIDEAIKLEGSKHKEFFLRPAIRVFDLRVNLDFQDKLEIASFQDKMKILRTIDCVGSRIVHQIDLNGEDESFGTKYSWTGKSFCRNVKMNGQEFIEYCQSVQLINDSKQKLLLEEYFKATNESLKQEIARHLPKKISQFPSDLWKQANSYLMLVK